MNNNAIASIKETFETEIALINASNASFETPRIFVTTYGLYNAGLQFANELTGFWVDALDYYNSESDFQAMFAATQVFFGLGDDAEMMFTDFENFPEELYGESGCKFELIEQWYEHDDQERINSLMDIKGISLTEAIENIDNYTVVYGSDLEDHIFEMAGITEDMGIAYQYFNWKSYAHDLEAGGELCSDIPMTILQAPFINDSDCFVFGQ